MSGIPASPQHLRDLALLSWARDRMDGQCAEPHDDPIAHPPAADPGGTDDDRRVVAEMMAKGTCASINLASADLAGVFDKVQVSGTGVVQEPMDPPYDIRDCTFQNPAVNMVRVQQLGITDS